MPKIALVLCICFVLFLLRLDRKQTQEVTIVLWIPTIWMLSIASKPLSVWFGLENVGIDSGSPWDRLFQIGFFCLGVFILIRRRFNFSRAIKENAWTMALIGYMLISVLWSDISFISLKRWFREVIAIVMAFLILTEPSPRQACESLFRRTVYILIPFSLLLIKYFPEYGRQYHHWSGIQMWVGVTQQKNGLGRLCIFSALFLIWTLVRRKYGRDLAVGKYHTPADVFVLIITLYLLKGPPDAFPATASVAFAASLAMFFSLLWMKKHQLNLGAAIWTAIMALVICISIAAPMTGGSVVSGFSSSVGRNETLTGRTDIWAVLVPMAMRQPIFGYGYGGFWTSVTESAAYYVKEAHNGYLDVFLGLGIVGVLLTSVLVLSYGWRAQRDLVHDYDWASLFICYILMVLLHNITESTIESFQRHLMAVLLFMAVSLQSAATSRTTIVRKNFSRVRLIKGPNVVHPKSVRKSTGYAGAACRPDLLGRLEEDIKLSDKQRHRAIKRFKGSPNLGNLRTKKRDGDYV